ncbi:MAG: hypothetical protein ABIQ24_04365 [Nitrospiraceae bacterium]
MAKKGLWVDPAHVPPWEWRREPVEASTDLGCDPAVQRAIVAGLRGDQECPRDA